MIKLSSVHVRNRLEQTIKWAYTSRLCSAVYQVYFVPMCNIRNTEAPQLTVTADSSSISLLH